MSDQAPPPKPRRRRRWLYSAAGAALVATGVGVGIGPAAPWAADQFADNVRVGRFGRLQLDGVSGSWLGDLHAERLAIADDEGVWLEAHDVALDWRPLDVIFGAIHLNSAHANAIVMHRQPMLLAPNPAAKRSFDVQIDALRVDSIDIAEAAYGLAASFTADLSLDLRDKTLRMLDLTLRRTDSEDDRVVALYRIGGDYALNVDAVSAPGGVLARALGVGEQGFTATAHGNGDTDAGTAEFRARVGAEDLLSGATRWSGATWSANVQANFEHFAGVGGHQSPHRPERRGDGAGRRQRRVSVHAETPFLAVELDGALDDEWQLDGPARFVATSAHLSDVARESPFELGAARLEGELRRARGTTAIHATLDARDIDALGRRVRLTGPVEASLSADRFHLSGDLRAPADAPALFAQRAAANGDDVRSCAQPLRAQLARLTGDALAFDAQGWTGNGDGEFSGAWRVRRLGALAADLTGEAGGHWRAFREDADSGRVWAVAVDGAGAGIDGAPT